MSGTAAALGCAAPTREGKAMGRPATAGESTGKRGDGRAEQSIATAWLGTAPRGKCMVGKARAKIGIARAEDCVGQLRRCKARRWLATAEHRNAQQSGGEAQLRGCGAGRRIGPHEHGAVRAAMAGRWDAGAMQSEAWLGHSDSMRRLCAATTAWQGHWQAWQSGGKAQRRPAWRGQCMALASKGKAHHRRATAERSGAMAKRGAA